MRAALQAIAHADSVHAAMTLRDRFARTYWRTLPKAVARLVDDWERMVAYDAFPKEHWTLLRTTNIIESPFAAVRLRTSVAKRFKVVEHSAALIWKPLLVVEPHFRKLNAPHLCSAVYDGVVFHDGVRPILPTRKLRAA